MIASATFITTSPPMPGLNSGTVLDMALRCAGTWELINLRTTLLTTIVEETSVLDDADLQTWSLSSRLRCPLSLDENRTRKVISAYEFTLVAPTDYLIRATRQILVQRAMVADVLLCQQSDLLSSSTSRSLAVLREFLKRYSSFQGSLDHEVS